MNACCRRTGAPPFAVRRPSRDAKSPVEESAGEVGKLEEKRSRGPRGDPAGCQDEKEGCQGRQLLGAWDWHPWSFCDHQDCQLLGVWKWPSCPPFWQS